MQPEQITIEVRSDAFGRIGTIDPDYINDLKLISRFNGVGAWSMSLPVEAPMAGSLAAKGRGIVVSGPVSESAGITEYGILFSGPVTEFTRVATSQDSDGIWMYSGVDDNIHAADGNAWPDPTNDDPTTQAVAYDVRTGPAETLLRGYMADNLCDGTAPASRAIAGLTLEGGDLARGASVMGRARFTQMGQVLNDIATIGGLGFKIIQQSAGLKFVVYEPQDKSGTVRMDIDNDMLTKTSYGFGAPTATRVVVAGQGEGAEREFAYVTSPEAAAEEVSWGRKIETFKDRRDAGETSELTQNGALIISENGKTVTSLAVVPSDQDTMRYSIDWRLGDIIAVVVEGQELVAIVTEAVIAVDVQGVRTAATIGDPVGFDFESKISARQAEQGRRVAALEKNSEQPSSAIAATPGTLVRRDGSGQLKAADGVADDDVATVGQLYVAVTPTQQVFTSSGTWSKPTGLRAVRVRVIGGGGGGAGSTDNSSGGAGAGSGAYAESLVVASSLSSTVTVTVGSGGTGNIGSGSDGGTSVFSSHATAGGGTGGYSSGYGGEGGSPGSGDITAQGSAGGATGDVSVFTTAGMFPGGFGAGSALGGGGGGTPARAANVDGTPGGANTGGGGGGGFRRNADASGGNGGSGVVIVENIF